METSTVTYSKRRNTIYKAHKRIWEIDFARGLFFLGVFIFHLAWDFTAIPMMFKDFNDTASQGFIDFIGWIRGVIGLPGMEWGIRIFSGAFLLLTGMCCSLSKDNLLRGLKIFAWGEVISLVTLFLVLFGQMDEFILFGILHCIGFVVALYGLWQRFERKAGFETNPWVYIFLGLVVWVVGYFFIYGLNAQDDPVSFTEMDFKHMCEIVLGTRYTYGDTFSLFPNAGKILVGIGLGLLVYSKKKQTIMPKLDGAWSAPIRFIGRHSLILYLAEQALAWVVIIVVMLALGFKLAI